MISQDEYKTNVLSDEQLVSLAKRNKVVFVSEDGYNFNLFLNGKLVYGTLGVAIKAGGDNYPYDVVEVKVNYVGAHADAIDL